MLSERCRGGGEVPAIPVDLLAFLAQGWFPSPAGW